MKKITLLLISCVLASLTMWAQGTSDPDCLPFVKKLKGWAVVSSDFGGDIHFYTYRLSLDGVEKDGKTYLQLYRTKDDLGVVENAGLLREENRKVYLYDAQMQREFLVFDYSLKAGDTYDTYSYDEQKEVTYKVLSVGDYAEGPEVVRNNYNERTDSTTAQRRYLRKWTVCRADDESLQKTWIEGAGSLEGPLENLYDARPVSSCSNLAYVNYGGDYYDYLFLPFSFHDEFGQIHGSNLPTFDSDYSSMHHQLTYELEGDRLHVYGKVFTQCGPNNYAYFIEEPTDDPLVRKLRFVIQGAEPKANCVALHSAQFYVPGFDPKMNYVVVDNQGEEHPVISRTPQQAYRPFVEDGKTWVVKASTSGYGAESDNHWIDYCYFDGDTIVNGQKAKRMFCDGAYSGAWYEHDKKVYCAYKGREQFEQLYDFTLSSNDSITTDGSLLVVSKISGGVTGFKGVYYVFDRHGEEFGRWFEGVGSESWPWITFPWKNVGAQGTLLVCMVGDEVVYCNDEVDDPYIMGSRRRFDFTHTIKTKPKAPMMRAAEIPLYGEYNDQQLNISLDPLDDAYLVRIVSEEGKVVYEKSINAVDIVGLNIDISSYPAGVYSVVLENGRESYTGAFEALTAGISDALRQDKADGLKAVYNLQGQRVSSLQKGLNIVNGRKVFVK